MEKKMNQQTDDRQIPFYPDAVAELSGHDGNAFAVLGAVRRALREADVNADEIKEFMDQATAGDYDHLLQTAMKWANVV
jgi:hypothetical protein